MRENEGIFKKMLREESKCVSWKNGKTRQVCRRDKKVSMKVKSKFYKTVAKSTVVNGTECKALNKIYKNKIEVTKMKILK